MALAYIPPGVSVQELDSPSLSPLLALPGSICLVGVAAGVITRTDTIQLIGTTAVTLPGVPANATMTSGSIVSVLDVVNPSVAPSGFTVTTDYTFTPATYQIARVVTSNTLASGASAGASSVTLTAGAVPAVGQVVRLTGGGNTEILTVLSVAGQVVTFATNLVNPYSGGATAAWGNIPDTDYVYVTYTYTPQDYFLPIRLNSMGDIQNRFGSVWDTTGTLISSALSFAASLAFANGASNVVLQPLYALNSSTGVRQQPTSTQIAAASTWSTVYQGLLDLEDVNIVVPVIGQSTTNVTDAVQLGIEEATQDFVYQMKHEQGQYVVAVLGEDSSASSSVAQEPTIISHAQTLQARYGNDVTQQLVMLNTSQFAVANATSALFVGGQYGAATIAGMLSARTPGQTLTRQVVAGLLSVTDRRTLSQKNNDAANGLLVVESKNNTVQVRHAITLDQTSVATRELNVVRSKHYVIESIRQTLDSQVIGVIVADQDAPTLVNNVVIGTLSSLQSSGAITAYANVQSRITLLDPTTMEVRFSYSPPFIINYINVIFALDLTSQAITVATDTASNG